MLSEEERLREAELKNARVLSPDYIPGCQPSKLTHNDIVKLCFQGLDFHILLSHIYTHSFQCYVPDDLIKEKLLKADFDITNIISDRISAGVISSIIKNTAFESSFAEEMFSKKIIKMN